MRKFLRLTAITAITFVPFVGCSDADTIGFTPIGEAGTGGTGARAGSGGMAGSGMSGSGGMVATAGMGGTGGISGAAGAAGDGGTAGTSGDTCALTECGTDCVDLNANATCGTTCENRVACDSGEFCTDGACEDTCESPNTECGDACVELTESPLHCNACDRACSDDGVATAVCEAGACAPVCTAGFGDCSVDTGSGSDDGCETALNTSDDCGACDRACDATNTSALACTAGACAPTCSAGFDDCNVDDGSGADDGCETAVNTSAECGACDRACDDTNTTALACNSGACAPTCAAGFADCNADDGEGADDGCETNLNDPATCGLACGAALDVCDVGETCDNGTCTTDCSGTICGSACVDLTESPAHCGACDRTCSTNNVATGVCSDSACAPVCEDGFGDCNPDLGGGDAGVSGGGDAGADDGCETDFSADESCGLACGSLDVCDSDESCVDNVCTPDCALTQCGAECIDTDTLVDDCGDCDRACSSSNTTARSCSGGTCAPTCSANFGDCSVDTGSGSDNGCETDFRANGSCGTACGNIVACLATEACVSSVCKNNLVTNSSAENVAIAPWTGVSGANVALTTAQANTGVQSVTSVGRSATFQGVGVNLTTVVAQGTTYNVSGFMRTSAPSVNPGRFSARADCTGGATPNFFLFITQTAVSSTAWTRLSGTVTVPTVAACPVMTGFFVYFENADGAVQILADDMVVSLP